MGPTPPRSQKKKETYVHGRFFVAIVASQIPIVGFGDNFPVWNTTTMLLKGCSEKPGRPRLVQFQAQLRLPGALFVLNFLLTYFICFVIGFFHWDGESLHPQFFCAEAVGQAVQVQRVPPGVNQQRQDLCVVVRHRSQALGLGTGGRGCVQFVEILVVGMGRTPSGMSLQPIRLGIGDATQDSGLDFRHKSRPKSLSPNTGPKFGLTFGLKPNPALSNKPPT